MTLPLVRHKLKDSQQLRAEEQPDADSLKWPEIQCLTGWISNSRFLSIWRRADAFLRMIKR